MKEDTRKIITYDGMKKEQMKKAKSICFGLGGGGIFFAFLLSLLISPLFSELSKGFSIGDPIYVFPFIIMGVFLFLSIAITLLPFFYGICLIYKILRGYSLEESEIEYVKPYEEEHVDRRRYGKRVYYYHGIYFKEHGKFLTSEDPGIYHAGDEYYLEILGKKNPKIVAIYGKDKYILK